MLEAFRHSMYTSADKVDFSISNITNGSFDQNAFDKVKQIPGVSSAESYLSQNVLLPVSLGGTTDPYSGVNSLTMTGVDPSTVQAMHIFTLASGRFLEPSDTDAIVISQYLATALKVNLDQKMTCRLRMEPPSFRWWAF
jgi:ABC-type lipoprotein release transport system permease subunit